jgi:8-oxo-dGTP pyrophosphatase MutT (NUDIX family)
MSRTRTQVEVIVFRIINNETSFLILKRNESKGSFWQPISGGVNEGEDVVDAAKRELEEETGIKEHIRIIENVHFFEFKVEGVGLLKEFVFAVEVDPNTKIKISNEHVDLKWCSFEDALSFLIIFVF